MKRQKTWGLFLVPLLIPVAVVLSRRGPPCAEQVDVSIGYQPEGVPGWKASLQRLGEEIQRCHETKIFIIHYTVQDGPGLRSWATSHWRGSHRSTIYRREDHMLMNSRFASGSSYSFRNVTDAAIHGVVSNGGSFDDLVAFGCEDVSP